MSDPTKHIQILLIGDPENDMLTAIEQLKRNGFAPQWQCADSGPALAQALKDRAWDLILCGDRRPGLSGPDALKIVRESGRDLPFIIISDAIGEEAAAAMIKAGASDCLRTDALGRLAPAVARGLREAEVRRENRRRETTLRKSGENLRMVETIAMLGNWEWDILSNEVTWSDGMYRICGMDPATDRPSYDLVMRTIAPEDRDRFADELDAALRNCRPFEGEFRMIAQDGRERYLHAVGEVVRDGHGRPVSMFGVVRDVTRRKKVEESLHKAEALYHELVETAQDLIWQCDARGHYTYLNGAWEGVLGYRIEEMLGKPFTDFQENAAARRELQLFERVLRTGSVKGYETVYRSRDGRDVALLFNAKAVLDVQGNVIGSRGTAYDITDRKRMEAQLREREEQYRLLVETANSVILTWDTTGKILFVNEYCERFLGFGKEELIGRNVVGTIVPERESSGRDLALLMQEIQQDPDRFRDTENENITRDGRRVWVRWANKAITDKSGTRIGILSVGTDITERRHAEERLRETNQTLNALVRHSPLAIVCTGLDGRVLIWNAAAERIFGWSEQETIGRMNPVVPEGKREEYRNLVAQVRDGHPYQAKELLRQRKDGTLVHLSASSSALYDAEGTVTALLGIFEDITERKRQEQAVVESEANYRSLFDSSTDGIFILDLDGNFIDANRTAYERLGYTRDEFLALNITGLDHPDYISQVPERLRSIRERGIAVFESGHLRKDGSVMPVEVNSRLLEYRGRTVFFSVIRDITDRKRAAEENDRLARAVSSVSEGIAVTDEQDRFIFVNDAHARTYGYTPSELLEKSWRNLTPRELVPLIERELERTLHSRSSGAWSGESPGVCKDGTVIATEITATARWSEKGEYLGHICVVRDITERKRTEEKIRRSEQFVRNILDTVDEGFIVIDRDYRIVTANKAYCGQAGMPCDEVIGRHCYEISHHASRPCYEEGEECAVRQVFATGEPHTVSHKHLDRDGQVMYVETKAFPIKDDQGRVIQAIETINNITEKHLLEEERLKTQKLESIGTLAGGIAHDFNNLLQGVFGYIAMAKLSMAQKERAIEMLDQAERAVHQSVSLTSQLLTFSKGGKPVKQRVGLRPVIENATRFALSGSRSNYRLEIAPDIWDVDADSGQVGQVIQNIVLNADQSMPQQGTVTVAARNVPATDPAFPHGLASVDYVMIEVQDSGVGIPKQIIEKIFDPYFTTKQKGSGLGLATSYSIIKNHDGRIDVRSAVGEGSVFTIYLPAAGTMPAEEQQRAAAPARRRGRILVMDDEEVIRNVARDQIVFLGHEAAVAEHGEAALRLYRDAAAEGRPFDVVVLDLTVRGGMGGMETLKRLLELDPGVKAVVSSGYSEDPVVSRYLESGFRAFLKKPYDIPALDAILRDLIQ